MRRLLVIILSLFFFAPTRSVYFDFSHDLRRYTSSLRNSSLSQSFGRYFRTRSSAMRRLAQRQGETAAKTLHQPSENKVMSVESQEAEDNRACPSDDCPSPLSALYEKTIQDAMALAEKYSSLSPLEFWEFLGHEQDIMVWKRKKPLCAGQRSEDEWPCVRSVTTIDLPVDQLADIIMDSTKTTLYNRYSGGREDVVVLGPNTKIVWNRTKIPLAMKSYDFCTLMHREQSTSDPQTTLIVSKAVQCPEIPEHRDFSRSEVIFGLNILSPSKTDQSKTEFTTISHVRYAGTYPFIAARTALQGSLTYFKSLKEAIAHLHPPNNSSSTYT